MIKLNCSILTLFFLVSILPLIDAETVQQGFDYDIQVPVRLEGGIVSGINCNITVRGPPPNKTLIVDFKEMTDQETTKGYHNYTLNETNISQKGEYTYFVTCLHSAGNSTADYSFLVNPTGIEPSTQRTDTISRSIYFIFGIAIILFVAFFFTKQSVPIKWTLFVFAIIFLLIAINVIFVSLQDEIVNPRLETFFSGFTVISWYFYWFAGDY